MHHRAANPALPPIPRLNLSLLFFDHATGAAYIGLFVFFCIVFRFANVDHAGYDDWKGRKMMAVVVVRVPNPDLRVATKQIILEGHLW